jgi:hypothetical protein
MTEHPYTASTITDDALDALYRRIETLEHVAAGNKRHVQQILPDLWRTEAALDRVRALHQEQPGGLCSHCNVPWPCLNICRLNTPPGCHNCGDHHTPANVALDEPKGPRPPTLTLLHHACGQLADVPGNVTLHPDRLSWPGHDCPADPNRA